MRKRVYLLWVLVAFCGAALGQAEKNPPGGGAKPFVLGVIDEIRSEELAETRVLNIYLPDGYKPDDGREYPVVYLLDGSADEDFIHIVGLYQYNNFPWIDRVPKSIVVGIANVDRRRDFTFPTTIEADRKSYPTTGKSAKFIDFIEKELEPFIAKKYRGSGPKTIIGESLGGLLAAEILLKRPQLFDKYVIVSPSLWWDDGSLLKIDSALLKKDFARPTGVYIGVGKEGLVPGDHPHVMEVDANLLAEKLGKSENKALTVHFDYLPQEDHATVTHQAVFNALRLLYPAKKGK
ncbi:MAG: alpha/beta hydrolase [Acidobacteria bacterium]|nr:alpha/beta hydrolase [Acidobacteriota bacterium]